jgi:hypothetical protein
MNTATNAPLTTAQAPADTLCAPLGDLQYNPLPELRVALGW